MACHEKPTVLAPDLAVDFACGANPKPEDVRAFLSARGFSSADEEAARRNAGKSFFPLQIDATDRHRVMIEIVGLKKPTSYGSSIDYHLTITSPPPTKHDRALEQDTVRFVRSALHCALHNANHFENGPDSVQLFDAVFGDMQRRMKAATRSALDSQPSR